MERTSPSYQAQDSVRKPFKWNQCKLAGERIFEIKVIQHSQCTPKNPSEQKIVHPFWTRLRIPVGKSCKQLPVLIEPDDVLWALAVEFPWWGEKSLGVKGGKWEQFPGEPFKLSLSKAHFIYFSFPVLSSSPWAHVTHHVKLPNVFKIWKESFFCILIFFMRGKG